MRGQRRTKKASLGFHDVRALRYIHAVLGLVLVVGGALELHAFAVADREDGLATMGFAVLAEALVFSGLWLLWGHRPERARPWAVAIFTGFWGSNLYRVIGGKCSAAFLGGHVVNPWLVLVFDTIALVLLLKWPRSGANAAEIPRGPIGTFGMVLTALSILVAGAVQDALVEIAGTARWQGRPLVDAPLVFRGNSVELQVQTDHRGAFRLPMVRPGLYSVLMKRSAIVSGSWPEANGPGPDKLARERPQWPSRKGRAGHAATKTAKKPGPISEVAREYADLEIVPVEVDDCSAGALAIEFH